MHQIDAFKSGYPVANYRNKTTLMQRNRQPCNSFFMVNMASGLDRMCVHLTMQNNDVVIQYGGHTPTNRSTEAYSFGLQHTSLILDIYSMLWSIDTCQNKASANQNHFYARLHLYSYQRVMNTFTAVLVPV